MNKKGFTLTDTLFSIIIFSIVILTAIAGTVKVFGTLQTNNKVYREDVNYMNVNNAIRKDLNSEKIANVVLDEVSGFKDIGSFTINGSNYEIRDGELVRKNLTLTKGANVKIEKITSKDNANPNFKIYVNDKIILINDRDYIFKSKI